jgi:hypothetical protein
VSVEPSHDATAIPVTELESHVLRRETALQEQRRARVPQLMELGATRPAFLSGFVGRHLDGSPYWGALDPNKDAYQAFSTSQWVPVGGGVSNYGRPLIFTTCVG